MSDDSPPPSLDDLDAKLRAAQAKRAARSGKTGPAAQGGGLSFALRIGVELVAALMIGVGIGIMLDRWLGTTPWMLVLFFVLGAAAGMLNVFRVLGGYGSAVGYRKPDKEKDRPDRDARRDG
ncbi:MAG: AtpZ/AtpI family protein [Kiloniellaceae bacterium]